MEQNLKRKLIFHASFVVALQKPRHISENLISRSKNFVEEFVSTLKNETLGIVQVQSLAKIL